MTNFEILTKQDYLKDVVNEWRRGYKGKTGRWYDDEKREIYMKLKALKSPTAEAINKIIGNTSWTELQCHVCEKDCESLVQLESAVDDSVIAICKTCLSNALAQVAQEAG